MNTLSYLGANSLKFGGFIMNEKIGWMKETF